jgi:hypothetical protein
MTDTPVTDRARRSEWRSAEQSPQASPALRNTFEAMNLFFSPAFSASC